MARNRLSCGDKDLLGLDNNLANARAVDFGHQFDLVNGFADLVLLEILHQLGFDHLNINRVLVDVLQVVLNVEKLALAEDRFHDLRVTSLNSLLRGRSHQLRALRFAHLVLRCPLATEDALIFQVGRQEVGVAPVAPAVAVIRNEC